MNRSEKSEDEQGYTVTGDEQGYTVTGRTEAKSDDEQGYTVTGWTVLKSQQMNGQRGGMSVDEEWVHSHRAREGNIICETPASPSNRTSEAGPRLPFVVSKDACRRPAQEPPRYEKQAKKSTTRVSR